LKSPRLHRRQIFTLTFSILILITAVGISVLDTHPSAHVNLQPYAFLLVCITTSWGAYRLRKGDILPIAYSAIIESIPDAVIILDDHDRIIKYNSAARNMLNTNGKNIIGPHIADCCADFIDVLHRESETASFPKVIEFTQLGKQCTYEIQRSPVLDGRGRIASQVIIFHDISTHIQAQKEKQERHRYLQALWSAIPDAIVVLDAGGVVQEWSLGAEHIFDIPTAMATGTPVEDLFRQDSKFTKAITSILDTQRQSAILNSFETIYLPKENESISLLITGSRINTGDKLDDVIIVCTDITNIKKVESSLRKLNEELEQRVAERTQALSDINKQLAEKIKQHQDTEESLLLRNRELLSFQAAAAATSSSLDLVFILETLTWEMVDLLQIDGCCVYQLQPESNQLVAIADYASLIANEPLPERKINLKVSETHSRSVNERSAIHFKTKQSDLPNDVFLRERQNLVLIPMVFQDRVVGLVELNMEDPNKVLTERQISLAQLLATQAAIAMENANLYDRAQQEIQDRQQAEAQIKASLDEKEMLLKEIHHRVKNNLQVISSLLSLQSRNVSDEETLTVLKESQDRIRSMALIHEKLYRSENLARIDFSSYLESLTNHLMRSYRSAVGTARLDMDVTDVSLSLETAVPCGLIVNELVSNALKHAFKNGSQGTITINLSKNNGKYVSLVIADDGVGLPESFDISQSDTLGLRLVNMLVGQVRGQLSTSNVNGARFEILFPTD
jgi:PAS domain S-box-containing protein